MSCPWAIRLARDDAAVLASLRLALGVEVAEAAEHVWVRGKTADEALARVLKALPALERFEWLANDRLRPIDSKLASGSWPALRWEPIVKWSRLQTSPAAFAGEVSARVRLRLVRSARETTPNLLLTDFSSWARFALTAGLVRLSPLRFAVNATGNVIISGHPLPPLPGRRFVEQDNIAVPAGWTWRPEVSLEIVRRLFNANNDTLIVWQSDDSFVRLHGEQLMPATRSGVRATAEALKEAR